MRGRSARALACRAEAVALHRQGLSFEAIARRVGYANRGTAHRVVMSAYKERIVEDIDLYRDMEVARLDEVMSNMWDIMVSSDAFGSDKIRAANTIIETIKQRSAVLGLTGSAAAVTPIPLILGTPTRQP